jgi:hypothetical protein
VVTPAAPAARSVLSSRTAYPGQLPNNDHGVTVVVMAAMVMTIRLCVSRDRKEGDERE